MTQVLIDIKFTKLSDTLNRYGGLAIDEPLVSRWWEANPAQSLGVINATSTITKSVDLADGSHTIEAGISAHSSTPWEIEIVINNQSLINGSAYSGANVSASFNIGAGEVVGPALKPLDRLKMIFQKLRSLILPDESIEAF